MGERVNAQDRAVLASGKVSDEAREFMLEVAACDEHLGDDGMCECARYHFAQLAEQAERDEEIEGWSKALGDGLRRLGVQVFVCGGEGKTLLADVPGLFEDVAFLIQRERDETQRLQAIVDCVQDLKEARENGCNGGALVIERLLDELIDAQPDADSKLSVASPPDSAIYTLPGETDDT